MGNTNNRISERLEKELTSFVTLLGGQVFNGVTYISLTDTPTNKQTLKLCEKVYDSVAKDGFSEDTLFRRFKVGNGFVYDLDLKISLVLANKIVTQRSKELGLLDLGSHSQEMSNKSKNVRIEELERLVSYLASTSGSNNNKVDIVLFNSTDSNTVSILGEYQGNPHLLTYQSFRLRHWDIANINDRLVQKCGRGIQSLNICEIIDNIGLRVTITLS